jgi:hypothetical protein
MANVTGQPRRWDEDELRAALAFEQDDLLIELGTFGAGIGPWDPLERGIRVYEAAIAKLRERVCQAENVRDLVEAKPDLFTLAAAVADVVAAHEHHLPVATVTALAVKSGVQLLCSDYWG